MVLNVWVRILPRQTAMLNEAKAGKTPNYELGSKAKARSTHNSYMTLPVLFAMLSNHFPLAYQNPHNWMVLLLLCILGAVIRHMMLEWNKGKTGMALLVPIVSLCAVLVFLTIPKQNASTQSTASFSTVKNIIDQRCLSCHSQHPSDALFPAAPNGLVFEDPLVIQKFAQKIRERVWIAKNMPLANRSQMTEEERGILAKWVEAGAAIHE